MPELEPITREEKFLNGEVGMTPITREEKILAGEDIETVTRREYFLKKYRGGGGGDVTVVPLSVTENGTYSEEGKAYSPVQVSVPDPVLKTKSITENGTYDASDDSADGYSQVSVNVPLPANAYLLKSVANLPQPIASFNDGADAPMKSLKVAIEPQQDLHGYDSPWVGGAGKNKLDPSKQAGSIGDSTVRWYETDGYLLSANQSYTMSCDDSSVRLYFRDKNGGTDLITGYSSITYTPTENTTVFLQAYKSSGISTGKFQLELGTTATAYAPYSNICPISGWDEVNVTRCGKNLFDYQDRGVGNKSLYNLSVGTSITTGGTSASVSGENPVTITNTTNWRGAVFFSKVLKVGVSYNFHYRIKGDDNASVKRSMYLIDSNNLITELLGSSSSVDRNEDFVYQGTVTPTTPNMRIAFCVESSTQQTITMRDIMIELSEQVTTYEPYAGNTYTIPFLDSQGNPIEVYGGELDVVNGTIKPNIEYDSYNGETLVGRWISDRDKYAEGTTPTIGAQVVDLGACGSDISVQPTAVKSLDGDNNVWADTGDITDAEYFSKEV